MKATYDIEDAVCEKVFFKTVKKYRYNTYEPINMFVGRIADEFRFNFL
jgi:hypothetical protein